MTVVIGEPVRFGMFDWLDESGRGQGATYEERLQMLELADTSGFYCYHLAEHHATELPMEHFVGSSRVFRQFLLNQRNEAMDRRGSRGSERSRCRP